MPVQRGNTLQNVVTKHHGAYVVHRHIVILLGEVLVFVIGVGVALDSEAGTVDIVPFRRLMHDVVKMDRFSGYWNLSYDSVQIYRLVDIRISVKRRTVRS